MNVFWRCFAVAAVMTATAGNVNAQDWKSVLGGVVNKVVGDKMTTETSILGTWKYVAPECQFESDDILSKAGGELASKEVEEKLQQIYDRVGMDSCQYVFNEDGSFAFRAKGRTMKGSYVFDKEAKTIEMKTRLGITSTAYVAVAGQKMTLVFNADKLMSALKAFSNTAQKYSSSAAALNKLASKFDGMKLGFSLEK